MNKKLRIAALALSACMALGLFCFTACQGTPGAAGKSAYDIWLDAGNTGSEQDFLNSLKGAPGTGTPGAAGKSAYDVWLDAGNTGSEQDFLNSLKGTPGTGTPGKDGNKITHGEGDPNALNLAAEEGDMYVDTESWNVYFFESNIWKNYGSIKGGGSEPEPSGDAIKNFGTKTITQAASVDLDVTDVDDGTYYLVAETSSTAAQNTLYSAVDDQSEYTYDMYSPSLEGYRSVVTIGAETTKITLSLYTDAADITAQIKLEKYEAPELKLLEGNTQSAIVEVPCIPTTVGYLPIALDTAFSGHTIKVKYEYYYIRTNNTPVVLDAEHNTLITLRNANKEEGKFAKASTGAVTTSALCFTMNTGCQISANVQVVISISE